MAGRDRTGPQGAGPMTGRGLGLCNPNNEGTVVGLGYGRGVGLGRGAGLARGYGRGVGLGRGGRGRGLGFYQADTRTQKEILTEEKQILEDRLNLVNDNLEEL